MNKVSNFKLFAITLLIIATLAIPIDAAFAYDYFYDKGRTETRLLYPEGMSSWDSGSSMFVLGASAWYSPSASWGRERIRVWSRSANLKSHWESKFSMTGVLTTPTRFDLRFIKHSAETRTDLWITGTDPVQKSLWTVPQIIYDIGEYFGYGGVVRAIANSITVDGTYVYSESGDTLRDKTVSFRYTSGFDKSKVDLPSNISYNSADLNVAGVTSGITAYYAYDLPSPVTNYRVWPQARLLYRLYDGVFYWNVWTGVPAIDHK